MSNFTEISRRGFIQRAGLTGMAAAFPGLWLPQAQAQSDLRIGFVYVGSRDDFGYNQSHAAGAEAVKAMPGVTVLEEENVAENVSVERTMESMINLDSVSLVFATSFGYYDPHVIKIAGRNPGTVFRHCGGLWEDSDPANAGSYFGYIDEGQYLNGVIAGHMTRSKRLGFIAAKPIPQVLRNINAFTLGARSVDPTIETQVLYTGDWNLPTREAEATNGLADQNVDVVTCHVDSPMVVAEQCASRGVYFCGYHASQAELAGDYYLTGAEWNWEVPYRRMVEAVQNGDTPEQFLRGGLSDGFVRSSDYGPDVTAAARENAEAIRTRMMDGDFVIFEGPMRDNAGNTVIEPGVAREQRDTWLERMDWLVEGVRA
ncbi:BMP family ABC transporter substrate-binding protein [Spiribacter roseus]|uniref:BMP family ABC transporter substrate-binding protein n=1 Tax=Spiribacter roseus TaxID=1855875 RepID=UPI00132FF5F9|nr:BMP family ABC transporter substrate-binding protein [Spiribacter roseus]KAF0282993.1 BMP family ABC transporter substrate-binding protein [Spiribacter roseus]